MVAPRPQYADEPLIKTFYNRHRMCREPVEEIDLAADSSKHIVAARTADDVNMGIEDFL